MMVTAIAFFIVVSTIVFVSLAWWDHTREYRLGGTYRVQCRICRLVNEIENPTVEELKQQQAAFNLAHRRCLQEMTGP